MIFEQRGVLCVIFIIYKDEAHIFHAYMAMKCVFQ